MRNISLFLLASSMLCNIVQITNLVLLLYFFTGQIEHVLFSQYPKTVLLIFRGGIGSVELGQESGSV